MINLENAEKTFLDYVSNYYVDGIDNLMIKRKVEHTLRVRDNSKIIASSLKLTDDEIDLATLIGLLHDIGRFEQQRIAHGYNDIKTGIDHAQMGVKVLFEDNKIQDFLPDTREYDRIIKLAVKNHNKFKIEEGLTEKEIRFCKIIRDADKLDVLEIFVLNDEDTVLIGKNNGYELSANITKEFLDALFENKQLDRKYQNYFLDWYLNTLTFLFDINYSKSFEIINQKKYVDDIIDRIIDLVPNNKEIFEKIRVHMNNYVINKI